jgi:hypothetical protein
MKPFKYSPPRASAGDLRTIVTFYKSEPDSGPEPGETQDSVLYESWAKVDHVWMKDLEQAKANKTLSDVTIVIRNPREDFFPTNKNYFTIQAPGYEKKKYNIEHVQTDFPDSHFLTIVGRLESWA